MSNFYHYHFDGKVHPNDLVMRISKFAKGLVSVDNNSTRNPTKHRIHCYHSCKKFKGFGAFAVRGDYIVYDSKGHLVSVLNKKLFQELYEEVR